MPRFKVGLNIQSLLTPLKMKAIITIGSILLFSTSCQFPSKETRIVGPRLSEMAVPCREGGEPNLYVSNDGHLYLSWVEYLDDSTDALKYSVLEKGSWSAPKTISKGTDWFVNWADFPSLTSFRDGGKTLATHWLQKSEKGTYDYDVHIALSTDSGESWGVSFIPHTDGIPAEHGFVSLVPVSKDRVFAVWLDGRNTNLGSGKDRGAMTLRTAEFDQNGNLFEEAELDNRTCDCCQTSAAMTAEGPIVAYRNRSEEEIRDIAYVRKVNGQWTDPKILFPDHWEIAGCPVNGPSVVAEGKEVTIAWFSRATGQSEVKIAFSNDAGATFSNPVRIDDGKPLGRVDVLLLEPGKALVSWLEDTKEGGRIRAVKVNSSGKEGNSVTLTQTSTSRQSGFPILAKSGKRIFLAWTQVNDDKTTVKTAEVIWD